MAKDTYFINSQYANRLVCWIGHCNRLRHKQRHERARILEAFAKEVIATIEKIRHGYWLVGLEAEATKTRQIVQDIYCADRLSYERICIEYRHSQKHYVSILFLFHTS